MMKLRACIGILTLSIVSSCWTSDQDLYQFDPNNIKEQEIHLSEIADDIHYIPLENNAPIGLIYDNIEFVNDKIYLSVRDVGILAFNMEGKLIRKIGSIGRGLGEYTYYFLFTVDDKNENVYVFDTGGIIKVFSKSGQFLRHFSINALGHTEKIKYFNSNLFILPASQFNNTENEWVFLDTLGNVIKKQSRKHPQFSTNWGNSYPLYKFDNSIAYYNIFGDTVYSISPGLIEIPKMTISQGEYRLPKSNLSLEQMLSKEYLILSKIQETSQFFILKYSISNTNLAIINKKDYSAKSVDLKYSDSVYNNGIINDLDGGWFFIPEHYFSENGYEYLVQIALPHQIKARVNTDEFINLTILKPEKKKEFKRLAESLQETDNPVLVMVSLKK